MKTLEIEKMSPAFRKAARSARGDLLVLTQNGKPQYAVVGVEDDFALEALAVSRNAEFMAYLDGVASRMRHESGATLDELEARFKARPSPPKRRSTRKTNGA